MTRRTRTVLDLQLVRDTLNHAQTVGVVQAAATAGVSWTAVYDWRRRRTASGGSWPTDADITEWRAQWEAGATRRAQHKAYLQRTSAVGGPLLTDSTGAQRRLRALLALGHRYSDVGAIVHRDPTYVAAIARGKYPRITLGVAAAVTAAYEQLSGTPGVSAKTRTYARRLGWPTPLSWDDDTIDDPTAQPTALPDKAPAGLDEVAIHRAMHGDPVRLTRAEKHEAVRQLTARGYSAATIAARLHASPRQVERYQAAS